MATLAINIPNAAVPRVQAAFGHQASPVDPTWVPATTAEVQQAMVAFLNQHTYEYEARLAAQEAIVGIPEAIPPEVPQP